MKSLLLLLLLSIGSFIAVAGDKYTVIDKDGQAVAGASVSIVSLPDSVVVKVKTTDSEGAFETNGEEQGNFIVEIKAFGFLPYRNEIRGLEKVVRLAEDPKTLGEVVVHASRSSLKMERGKFVFNPGDIKDKVTNSLDVLKWTPLLTTTDEGVSILGSGPSVIYINGRRPVEGQEEALDMLKSTSPSLIRRIEIVTMAGSSQSASSGSGIVNIIIDNPSEGWRGSVTGKLDYTDERFSPSGTLWLYNATGKLRTSGSLVYLGKATNNEMESWYQYGIGGKTVTNNDKTTGWRDAIRLNVNATYDINSKSLAGVSLSLRETKKHTNSATTTVSEENGIKTKSESLIESRFPFLRPNLVVRGFYELAAGPKGSKLEIRGDFSSNVSKNERKYSIDGDIDNEIYKDNSRGIHASADYSWKINKDHRLKVGYDYAGSRLGYTLSADDSEREFIYRESINSAYAEWSSSWTNAIYTSLGVRMEDSDIKGDMKTSDDSYARHYTDLFPSFRIGINIPKGSQNISLVSNVI